MLKASLDLLLSCVLSVFNLVSSMLLCNDDCWTLLMCGAIWCHLYHLKNVKNTHGGVLLLVKLQAKSQIAQRITM